MAKPKNPNRDKAFELFKKHRGDITNRDIAQQLGINEKTLSRWKSQDKWNEQLGINKVRSTKKSPRGKTSQSNDFRSEKKGQVESALVEAGSYSPALDLLIDIYLDAYEEYERLKGEGIADEKSRRELARLLGQLGLDGKNRNLTKQNGVLLDKQAEEKEKKEAPTNKLLQFRQRVTK